MACFWWSQGRCVLEFMDPGMVYSMLSRIPAARESTISCTVSCAYITADYLAFAQKQGTLVKDDSDEVREHMGRINTYKDTHRLAASNPTLAKDTEE